MNDNYPEEKRIPLGWSVLFTLVLWGFLGTVAYICGLLARAALGS